MPAPAPQPTAETAPLAVRLAAFVRDTGYEDLPAEVAAKARTCILDYLSCVYEGLDRPWSRQALDWAAEGPAGGSTVFGAARGAGMAEAAFANGALGHALVREDMHAASVCHIGVVVIPAVLAVAEARGASGRETFAAIATGYEVTARIGRALIDREIAARFRPTGLVGPVGAAAAAARAEGADETTIARAMALAANTSSGLNEWPRWGGSEMFFHPGFAARSAVTCAGLARLGAAASLTALDGDAGLFAAFGRGDRATDVAPLADGSWEIMAVYHKGAPACNYVQTACRCALDLVEQGVRGEDVAALGVALFPAAIEYPGCDNAGPFDTALAAKMSIQYSVAAVLARGALGEANYDDLDDALTRVLVRKVRLSSDPEFTRNFPPLQGAEVTVTLADGSVRTARRDDNGSLDAAAVRSRFLEAAGRVLGEAGAVAVAEGLDRLETMEAVTDWVRALAPKAGRAGA